MAAIRVGDSARQQGEKNHAKVTEVREGHEGYLAVALNWTISYAILLFRLIHKNLRDLF
jgi:hypothetical protein